MTDRDPPRDEGSGGRRLRLFPVSAATLLLLLAVSPWMVPAAVGVIQVDATTPMEWVPPDFPARAAYERFTAEFESGDVVIASWDGCTLGAPAITAFAAAASGPDTVDRHGDRWFETVASGDLALARLVEPPLALERDEATERLRGVLVGPDGRKTCLVIPFTRAGLTERRAAVAWIRDTLGRITGLPRQALHLAGPVVDNVSIDEESMESFFRFGGPGAIVILLLTWWSLGSLAYALLVFLVSLACVGLNFWFMATCGDRMNPILIVMPVLVLTLGVSGGIHLTNYLIDALAAGGREGVAWRAIRLGWLPCSLSAGTTAIGLVSLVVSELEPIRVFGFHAAIGVMLTLAMLFLVVPGIFERWPIDAARGPAPRSTAIEDTCSAFMVRHAGPIAWIGTLAMIVAAVGIPRIRASVSIETLFTPKSTMIRDYAWIEEAIGPLVPVEVVLRFRDDAVVRPAERLAMVREVGEELARLPGVTGVLSAATFLPDLALGSGLRGQAAKSIAARKLQQNLAGLDDMRIVRDVAGAQLWRVTARTSALSGIDFGDFLGVVRERIEPVVAAHGGASRGVTADYTGAMPLVNAIQKTLLSDLFSSFLSAFVVITLMMVAVERSLVAGLVSMIPNTFPTILLFGFLGWAGTALDIGSVMTASIALGMAIDGTLHFLTFFRRGLARAGSTADSAERRRLRIASVHGAFRHSGAALTESSVVCAFGILMFAWSSFAPTSRFAWLLALLISAALAGDLVYLPALLVGRFGGFFRSMAPADGDDIPAPLP
jgi:predicted RND superfamily exporter protein